MSSLGKSIGRIQSAPPDEGEPDLKAHLNLNAVEFNPSNINVKANTTSKGLSAQANDFVPVTVKISNVLPTQSYQPNRGNKVNYKYSQPNYPIAYPNTYNYGYQHNTQHHYSSHHTHHQVNPVNTLAFQSTSLSDKNFSFNADTPSFEVNYVDKVPEFEFKPAQSSISANPAMDFDFGLVKKPEEGKDALKVEEGKKGEGSLIEASKLQDLVLGMELSIKELGKDIGNGKDVKGGDDGKDREVVKDVKMEEIVDEKVSVESPAKPDTVIESISTGLPTSLTQETTATPDPIHSDSLKDENPSLIQESSTPTPPLPPGKRVYDLETIKNFKLDFRKDPNFINVPEQIMKLRNREVEEARIQKNRKNQDEKRITREVTQKLIWRKAKTAEEQKISEKAKAYTRKFTATVVEQEKIKKEIKSTLNKLSPNNLPKLTLTIMDTCKKSHDCLKLVVSGIFEKAWSEKKYTQMYSDICKTLKSGMEGYRYPDIDPSKLPETRNYFKYELLYMCEETFNKNHQEEIPASLTEEQKKDRLKKLKEKTLGNVRFIGELFNVNLITAKIVLECVTGLLDLFESESNQDRLEGACLLLHTGGATFERSKVLQETNRIYDRLTEISNMDISTKNKFKIMDLKEFRESGWKAAQKEGLKKVEEIHADHMMEQEEIKRRHGYNN